MATSAGRDYPESEGRRQAPIILSAFNLKDKSSGFYQDQVTGSQEPRELLMKDEHLSSLLKAQESDVVVFTRGTFQRFPDLWARNNTDATGPFGSSSSSTTT